MEDPRKEKSSALARGKRSRRLGRTSPALLRRGECTGPCPRKCSPLRDNRTTSHGKENRARSRKRQKKTPTIARKENHQRCSSTSKYHGRAVEGRRRRDEKKRGMLGHVRARPPHGPLIPDNQKNFSGKKGKMKSSARTNKKRKESRRRLGGCAPSAKTIYARLPANDTGGGRGLRTGTS